VQRWLERTPGLAEENYLFWDEFRKTVDTYLEEEFLKPAQAQANVELKEQLLKSFKTQKEIFDSVIEESQYNKMVERGERTFSHKAFQGAIMIYMYREEPRYSQPFQVLQLLIEIDSFLTKWRHNHVVLIQRMIGTKIGTGGSSGFTYLRSTVSERYMPFVDLFKLSTYMVPRHFIPPLSNKLRYKLSLVGAGDHA